MTAEHRGDANVSPDQREQESVLPDDREDGNEPRGEAEDEAEAESTRSDGGTANAYADHLGDVPDGSGCTEIWEHLSEEREDDD